MGRGRKPAARRPLAPKDSNVVHHQQPHLTLQQKQMMMNTNHREAERHIAAIRAVRDAQVEGYLTQLRVAHSMLSKEVRVMRIDEFVSRFCPDRELSRDPDSSIIELRHKPQGPILPGCPCVATSFEFHTENPDQSLVQPTPCGFPFSSSSGFFKYKIIANDSAVMCSLEKYFLVIVRDTSLQMADKVARDEPEDEEFLKFMESFRSSKFFHSNATTPGPDGHSMFGVTPKTMRLPKKGETLLSVNGSPLGVFEKDGIQAIPEERPRRARRRLRASVLSNV